MNRYYAQVLLPLPVEGEFSYKVPESMADRVHVGSRVVVQFGARRFYTGIVIAVSTIAPPPDVMVKDLTDVLDPEPIIRKPQLRFWEWMAGYYLCTPGEVYNAALPSGLKISSETQVSYNEDVDAELLSSITEDELDVLTVVRNRGHMAVRDLEKIFTDRGARRKIQSLIEHNLLTVSEKLVERYRPVRKIYAILTIERGTSKAAEAAFKTVKKSPRQEKALVALMALSNYHRPMEPLVDVPFEVLSERAGVTREILRALEKKGLCRIVTRDVSRFSYSGPPAGRLPELSPAQTQALNDIFHSFSNHDIVLLHGVTSSGKTEIYTHLIDYVLKQGKQALMLVPEIALTTQLTERLQRVFGPKVLIYHSKFTDAERVELWRRVLRSNGPMVVLGARSAVFLPFASLGLVIVDEEHEASYKQNDPAPRYNGRDAATVLARMHGAKTLFGSATPSVETYYKAQTGKFGLVSLTERYAGMELPPIEIVDMRQQYTTGDSSDLDTVFSGQLIQAVHQATAEGRQAILFLNRRGFAPVARCRICGFTSKCDHCDVSLSYHRSKNRMQCHYCGCEYPVPRTCPQCGEPSMEVVGFGTERLEDALADRFADRRIMRMDLDTTRNKESYNKIIDGFSAGKADILVGTQMVTKGLDFGGVQVVGVVNADALINYPDFRSAERAFNMMEQVAGRAGRREGGAKVIVQTRDPEQPLLGFTLRHDYAGFYNYELEQRRIFNFPPFRRVINIYLKHRDFHTLEECAARFAGLLRESFGTRVAGPQEPPVGRVQNMFIRKIMLKMEPEASMPKVKAMLRQHYIELQASPIMRGLTVYYDVDPV